MGQKLEPTSLEVITFDSYGTLIDWERALVDAFAEEARRSGHVPFRDQALLPVDHSIEAEVQAGSCLPYRDVLTEIALRIYHRAGQLLDAVRADFLSQSLPS